jgi:murein DD-endopeptidase MepM/ murein hydrolase activator NlpD
VTPAKAILLLAWFAGILGGCSQSRFVCAWPVDAPRITQDYGCYACIFPGKHHSGMDLTSALEPVGSLSTRVFAAADGKVLLAHGNCPAEGDRSCGGGLGNHLLIGHHNGYATLYAHLDRLRVHQGDRVVRGGVIGNMGRSGNASGVHLHFDLLAFTPASLDEIGSRYTDNLPEENGHLDPKKCFSHKVVEICEATTVLERPVSYHVPSPDVITTLAGGQRVTVLAESSGGWHYIYLPSTAEPPRSAKAAYGWVQGGREGAAKGSSLCVTRNHPNH